MRDSGILKSLIYKKIIPCDATRHQQEQNAWSDRDQFQNSASLGDDTGGQKDNNNKSKNKNKTKNPQTSHGCNVCADANSGPSVSAGSSANLG